MRRESYDVIVVGGGVMGTSAARALAARGRRVLLLERFHIPHKRGSSHGSSRIFRLSYPEEAYVAMAKEALDAWHALERDSGAKLLTTTGGLDAGKRLDDHVAALATNDIPHEVLTVDEAAERWPFMGFPTGDRVLFQADAGILAAERAWKAFASLAAAAGADIREETAVEGIEVDGPPAVTTSAGAFEAETIVVTAGAWAKGLLAGVGIDLDVRATRETVAYFDIDRALPPTFVDWGDPSVYALPSPGRGLKAGEHIAGPTTDPDEVGWLSRESLRRLRLWMRERYPSAAPEPHYAETCIYTNTPDEHFVLERHGPVVVGSPCSGHGFKFAPLIGERLADLVG
ncbi:MAG TPA: N-methyl-L-tryptophan oxidase [Actinomycetota bacterium]|nr:N-methyl-L-tryptophan oxidase [Actinomycetota bacterium]